MNARVISLPKRNPDKPSTAPGASARVYEFPLNLTQRIRHDFNPFRTDRPRRVRR
jgi:hypothetical protein